MQKAKIERGIAVLLFVLVLITFSFAQRDSKKLDSLYTKKSVVDKKPFLARTTTQKAITVTGN
jgi:hypothetical protein